MFDAINPGWKNAGTKNDVINYTVTWRHGGGLITTVQCESFSVYYLLIGFESLPFLKVRNEFHSKICSNE